MNSCYVAIKINIGFYCRRLSDCDLPRYNDGICYGWRRKYPVLHR